MVKKLLIYVTGPINNMNEASKKRSITAISLACRNVLLSGNIPVCPIISIDDFSNDPRIKYGDDWWINNYCVPMMEYCQYLCYVPNMAGMVSKICELEKAKWREIKSGRLVMADTILKFLLSINRSANQTNDKETVYVLSGD